MKCLDCGKTFTAAGQPGYSAPESVRLHIIEKRKTWKNKVELT